MGNRRVIRVLVRVLVPAALATVAGAQAGWVLSHQKISQTEGGFTGALDDHDNFGYAVASLGDVDGDGVGDLAVGARSDDDGGTNRGAVWVLFLNPDGTVKAHQKISQTEGGFGETLDDGVGFGTGVAPLGDFDGDGIPDLAVSAPWYYVPLKGPGAVWILLLHPDGTVKAESRIDCTSGQFWGALGAWGLATLGDVDGNGVVDLAVGSPYVAAVWIVFLEADGTVKGVRKIGDGTDVFPGELPDGTYFGRVLSALGDFNGDGGGDLVVGVDTDDTGGHNRGAAWILLLRPDGSVFWGQKIASDLGGFTGELVNRARFGAGISPVGDLDGDGILDLAVGSPGDPDRDDGDAEGDPRGAVWILFLDAQGTVRAHQKISDVAGGFEGKLHDRDQMGGCLAFSDVLIVGVELDDDGGSGLNADRGALWLLDLRDCPPASSSFRNPDVGGTTNPPVYDVVALPVLGGEFVAAVGTAGKSGSFLTAYAAPFTLATPWGILLVDVTDPDGELSGWPSDLGDPAMISVAIPDDPALCGLTCSTQAVRFGGGFDLTNARDLVLGR